MKLIDKDAVVTEIERLMTPECGYSMNKLLDYIETLEVKEVDLTKEIAHFALNGGTGDNTPTIGEVARHFYSLGLTQKGEDV